MGNNYTRKEIVALHRQYSGWTKLRSTNLGGGQSLSKPHKMLCVNCKVATKRGYYLESVCQICGCKLVRISPRVRVPRKASSKRTWAIFLKRFVRM